MKSIAQKKREKAAYDRARRERLGESLREKRRAAYAVWGPLHRELERKRRQKGAQRHVEYCRRADYKAKKKVYDHKRMHGRYDKEWTEVALLLDELQKEIRRQQPDRFARYAESRRHGWSLLTHAKRREKHANERIVTLESICC